MERSLNDILFDMENVYGDRICFQWFDSNEDIVKAKKYSEFVNDIRKYVSYLKDIIGDKKDVHIAFMAPKSYHFSVAVYACLQMGVVAVPFNIGETEDNIKYQMDLADINYIVYDVNMQDVVSSFDKDLLIKIDGYTDYPESNEIFSLEYTEKPAVMVFTSGTTGASKCVAISLNSILVFLEYLSDWGDALEAEVGGPIRKILHILPLYHIAGISTIFGWTAMFKTVNLCCDMKNIFRDINVMESEYTVVVPMILQSWAQMLKRGASSCIGKLFAVSCVGASLDEKVVQIFSKYVKSLSGGYSMTEICAAGLWNQYYISKNYGSLGKPGKGVEVRVEDGEICIKSDAMMLGYYKNEEETNAAIKDGWIHTGDLGYMDDAGYVYLTGRKKNLIILANGENVSPEELENLIYKNQECKEVIVKEKNKKICAEIYCDEDKQEELEDYISELNNTLAMYKHIADVEFRNIPFEKNGSGKIVRGC